MLEQLLRTKLDPRVDDWVARGRDGGQKALREGALSETQLAELWEWAPVEANAEARRRDWGGDFTLEEMDEGVKGVVTGLRRRLDEGGEEDEEMEEDAEEEGEGPGESGPVQPSMPLDDVLRFMTTGVSPTQRS